MDGVLVAGVLVVVVVVVVVLVVLVDVVLVVVGAVVVELVEVVEVLLWRVVVVQSRCASTATVDAPCRRFFLSPRLTLLGRFET